MATTATKVCTVCKRDCADLPRVKDEHGRYTCRACLDGPASASPAAQARPAREDDGFDLRAAALMEAKSAALELPESQSCPKCHGFLPEAARLCMRCGFDRKRGAKVQTRVEKVKEEPSATSGRRRKAQQAAVADKIVWAVCLALLAMYCVGFFVPVLLLIASPLLSVLAIGTTITLIIFAFLDQEPTPAGCGIAYIPIALVSVMGMGVFGPILGLAGLLIAFLCWARLMYYGATQGRGWLSALSNTVVAQIILSMLLGVLFASGALPRPEWLQEMADERASQRQGTYQEP